MSLHFIFGRAGTGKTTRCCREIQDYLKKTPGGRAYLLVPDQGTYTAEYLLAKSFPGAGFIDVTVCGFSRLAYRVFQELHSPVADALSPLGQQIILRRLLTAHKDELQVILRAASQPHFSEKLTAFFHQLDMFLVTEDDLLAASKREGETPLGKSSLTSPSYIKRTTTICVCILLMKGASSTFLHGRSPSQRSSAAPTSGSMASTAWRRRRSASCPRSFTQPRKSP